MSTINENPVRLAAVNTPAGLAAAAVGFTTGWVSMRGMIGGSLRGTAHQDVAGTLLIEFSNDGVLVEGPFTVTQDATLPGFQYPFSVIVLQPFARVRFTNGGAPSTFFRASVQAQPF